MILRFYVTFLYTTVPTVLIMQYKASRAEVRNCNLLCHRLESGTKENPKQTKHPAEAGRGNSSISGTQQEL